MGRDNSLGRVVLLVGLLWSTLGLLSTWQAAAQQADLARARDYTQQAFQAYQEKNYTSFLNLIRQAEQLRPNHPGLVYNLASAYALAGEPQQALEHLTRYADMGLVAAPGEDDDLVSLRELEEFDALLAQIERNNQPTSNSEEAFRLSDPAFVPEGVAYDPQTGAFFIASVHQRRIVRVNREGQEEAFASVEDGLWSVLGIAVDPERRRLWAASAAMKQAKDLPEEELGPTALFLFDLDTGKHLRTFSFPFPTDERPHAFGDLTLNAQGDVFTTDGLSGGLYMLREGADALETALEPGTLASPQGLCFGQGGRLFMADYSLGVLAVDLQARRAILLAPPENTTLLGIDGLACYQDRLLAIQNGVRPHRVLELTVDGSADRITSARVLEANHARFQEPTLGTVVGDMFYYVANSQWNLFDENGTLPAEAELQPPLILKLSLPK